MTSRKTEDDLKPAKSDGPEILGEGLDDKIVEQLKKNYPRARQIERLPSGNYAIRFRSKNKKTAYWRPR